MYQERLDELAAENRSLREKLDEAQEELRLWYENGVFLTTEEKQYFYSRFRQLQRERREKEEKEAEEKLRKMVTRVCHFRRKRENEEGI